MVRGMSIALILAGAFAARAGAGRRAASRGGPGGDRPERRDP